jgi:hypothetical protein
MHMFQSYMNHTATHLHSRCVTNKQACDWCASTVFFSLFCLGLFAQARNVQAVCLFAQARNVQAVCSFHIFQTFYASFFFFFFSSRPSTLIAISLALHKYLLHQGVEALEKLKGSGEIKGFGAGINHVGWSVKASKKPSFPLFSTICLKFINFSHLFWRSFSITFPC